MLWLPKAVPGRRDVGESIEDVSRFLDHSSLAVTTTYLRRLEGQEDRSWGRVAAAIGLKKPVGSSCFIPNPQNSRHSSDEIDPRFVLTSYLSTREASRMDVRVRVARSHLAQQGAEGLPSQRPLQVCGRNHSLAMQQDRRGALARGGWVGGKE